MYRLWVHCFFLGWNGRGILEAIALQSERKLRSSYLLQKFKI